MTARRRRWMAALVVGACSLSSSVVLPAIRGDAIAWAQAEREQARKLGEQGLEAFEAKRWQEAYDRFAEADKLFHAPTLVLYMARCQSNLGKPVEATALYERLLAEAIPPNASKQFVDAHEAAKAELPAEQAKVATLQVVLTNVGGAPPAVLIDGAPVPADQLTARKVNPGEHSIEVVADGVAPIVQTVTVEPGGTKSIEIALPTRSGPAPAAPPAEEPSEGSLLPAIAAFAVGAAGFGVGAVTGIMTLSRADDLKSQCDGTRCPAQLESEADRIDALAVVSTVGFIVGGVATATGVVLVVVRPGGGDDTSAASVDATFGPGGVDLRGRF